LAAAHPHHFLSVHKNGQVAIVETEGNTNCHLILRGGKTPNYDAEHVETACRELEAARLHPSLMVDCSHANSRKQHEKQVDVARDIAHQIAGGSRRVFGVMVESHLAAGAQKFSPGQDDPASLEYGKSITDACIGWEDSLAVMDLLSQAVTRGRAVLQTAAPRRAELHDAKAPQRLELLAAAAPYRRPAVTTLTPR
jgi:3-deoxy-7-phosphoheptulonate synthase